MIGMKQVLFILLTAPLFIFAQCLEGDCQNGNGKFKFKNGNYVGGFVNGEIDGQGVFSTRIGYSYNGEWVDGEKSGIGQESIKKISNYSGEFHNNMRHGQGTATYEDTRHMEKIAYSGEWNYGAICGEGALTYARQVKYGREKVLEKNQLIGKFINGVYQGRQTSAYPDELPWESFGLKMEHFQKYESLTEREQKKIKNPATIEGSIVFSCECIGNTLLFNVSSILRKQLSWWSTDIIAADTKPIILNMKQREFDILEWHARALELELNKQKLICNMESIQLAWSKLMLAEREANQVRKTYSTETAWNPKRGMIKNTAVQEKWGNKISKKLRNYSKANKKLVSKLKKKFNKLESVNRDQCVFNNEIDASHLPIKREAAVKESVIAREEVSSKPPRSFRPTFPRSNQLE